MVRQAYPMASVEDHVAGHDDRQQLALRLNRRAHLLIARVLDLEQREQISDRVRLVGTEPGRRGRRDGAHSVDRSRAVLSRFPRNSMTPSSGYSTVLPMRM